MCHVNRDVTAQSMVGNNSTLVDLYGCQIESQSGS
jgi:hypothetical protein